MERREVSLIEKALYSYPLALEKLNNPLIEKLMDYYLPYSVGFEIECNNIEDSFKIDNFENIPNILHVNCDFSEKRFRIDKGLKGIITLYNICLELPKNCSLNEDSGIHYHIDMTDVWENVNSEFVNKNNNFIIKELIKWETAKDINSYNAKCFYNNRGWVNFQPEFKTCEIRIGEMTFDYSLILKRMIDGCRIVRELKNQIGNKSELRIKRILKELEELEGLDEIKNIIPSNIELKQIINKRIIKI